MLCQKLFAWVANQQMLFVLICIRLSMMIGCVLYVAVARCANQWKKLHIFGHTFFLQIFHSFYCFVINYFSIFSANWLPHCLQRKFTYIPICRMNRIFCSDHNFSHMWKGRTFCRTRRQSCAIWRNETR
jgi:hypothetical protein